MLWAGLFGFRIQERHPLARDRRGRFLRARPYAPGPAEALGLHPKLNEISKVPFDDGDGTVEGEDYRRRLRRWVTKNMDQWLSERRANLGMVFCALEKSERIGFTLSDEERIRLAVPSRVGERGSANSARPSAAQRSSAPKWDPHFDIVANLPESYRKRLAEQNYGVGNTSDEAKADYYRLHEKHFGEYWREFTLPPWVTDECDNKERWYCVARPDPSPQNAEWDSDKGADSSGAADCQSAYAATLGSQADSVTAPLAGNHDSAHNPIPAQGEGSVYHRDNETQRNAIDLSVTRCLGGKNTVPDHGEFDMRKVQAEIDELIATSRAAQSAATEDDVPQRDEARIHGSPGPSRVSEVAPPLRGGGQMTTGGDACRTSSAGPSVTELGRRLEAAATGERSSAQQYSPQPSAINRSRPPPAYN